MVLAAVVVAVVVIAALLAARLVRGDSDDSADPPSSTSTPSGSASTSPSAGPSSGPSGSATPSQSPPTSPDSSGGATGGASPDLPRVATAAPHRLVVDGLVDAGFDNAVPATEGRLIPTDAALLARWADRGQPGSPGQDTVVIVGAATASRTGAFSSVDQVRAGQRVELETRAGMLTYTVRSNERHAPEAVLELDAVTERHPGRLVLVVAHYDGGNRQGQDTVVLAELTGATPH